MPMSDNEGVIFSPVEVEHEIRNCANRIAKSVSICNERYTAHLAAERVYDRAYAQAYLAAKGPAHEKKYHAEVATGDERQARDIADAAYRYADRTSKAVDSELRAWQSVGVSVRQAYGVAGRGEG